MCREDCVVTWMFIALLQLRREFNRDKGPGNFILFLNTIELFSDTVGGSSCQKETPSKINTVFTEIVEGKSMLG